EIGDSEDDGDVRDHEQMLLLLIIILFVCKPWRFLLRSRSSPFSTFKVGDLQRPLVSHDENLIQGQSSEVSREFDLEEACFQNEGLLRSSLTEGRGVYKPRLPSSSSSPHLAQGESFDLQIISEPSDNALVGETLKHPADKVSSQEVQTYGSQQPDLEKDILSQLSPRVVVKDQNIHLSIVLLLVTFSHLPGFDFQKLKWELVDMGSLNGTLLNSRSVSHPDLGSRKWGHPVELASDDIITLGTTSMVSVSFI
ncbi:unnamed protein product, partial [Brassica rapa]